MARPTMGIAWASRLTSARRPSKEPMSGRTGYGRPLMNEKYLRIYLQDHLAGSTAGLELARRTRGANQGTEYGPPLAKIADEIEADRRMLQGLMEDLGF